MFLGRPNSINKHMFMGRWSLLQLSVTCFHVLLLCSIFSCSVSTTSGSADICIGINLFKLCGRGTCHANATAPYGYDCTCDPGWRSVQMTNFSFPSCIMPNCSVDFQCGNGAPPQPPPPPPLPVNITTIDPCNYIWCVEGKCSENGFFNVTCKCPQDSGNLDNDPRLPCFKKCYLGGDCNNGLYPPTPSPTSDTSKGSNDIPSCSRSILLALITILSATLLLTRF